MTDSAKASIKTAWEFSLRVGSIVAATLLIGLFTAHVYLRAEVVRLDASQAATCIGFNRRITLLEENQTMLVATLADLGRSMGRVEGLLQRELRP